MLSALGFAGGHWYAASTGSGVSSGELAGLVDELQQAREHIDTIRQENDDTLNAIAFRIAQMNARMIRLDALGRPNYCSPRTYDTPAMDVLYRNEGDWKVYDVSANGQSAIVHYRQQLMREVQERRMRQMRRMQPPGPRMGPGMPPPGYGPRY